MRVAHDAVPAWIDPMLAKPDGGRLREGPQWAYEYKLDGYRVAMRIATDGTTMLTSRNGLDLTAEFAELTGVLTAALRGRAAVLDGEVVVYNEAGQIDFGLLQQRRGRFQKYRTARREEPFEDVPVRFLVFDLLQLDHQLLLGPALRAAAASAHEAPDAGSLPGLRGAVVHRQRPGGRAPDPAAAARARRGRRSRRTRRQAPRLPLHSG
ncbi:hypothetical protein G7043_20245 [Lentzea sp. NEAU-D13]|uniref:ATP-dependent DNA ligase family profile domain-containing protein n=1 Tax=Lentzea alba TaxID=2714351 RepID=A0A7C9W0U1_9PSEU|nr:hypothetical protein [Lentzea alba]